MYILDHWGKIEYFTHCNWLLVAITLFEIDKDFSLLQVNMTSVQTQFFSWKQFS